MDIKDAYMARIVPYNPFAFPPSMEVRCWWYDYKEVIGRVEYGTETESNVWTTTWMWEVEYCLE